MNVGEYWFALANPDHEYVKQANLEDHYWLTLIAAKSRRGGRSFFLAIKCDMKSKRPLVSDGQYAAWFDESGKPVNDDCFYLLTYKDKGCGRKYLGVDPGAGE